MGQVFGRGAEMPLSARLLIATAVAAVVTLPLAASAAPPSCKSITKGTLDVELPAGQRSSRMVRLSEGETVNFSIHSGASGATVTLVSGSAPQTLLAASSGGMASYCAPSTATYVFVIEAGRDNLTSVSANCTPAGATAASDSAASRQEMDLAQLDTDAEGLSRRSAFSLGLSEIVASTRAAHSPINQWIGDDALVAMAIDTAAGDDDAAGAAASSFSANSEVGPDDLEGVLARMQRVTADAAADTETQTAMTWSAILAPGLSFAPAPQTIATAKSTTRKPAQQVATADAAAAPAVEDWWVTHLQDNREGVAATETAVTRRDAVASNAFPTPPMALGAFVPPADQLPASTTSR